MATFTAYRPSVTTRKTRVSPQLGGSGLEQINRRVTEVSEFIQETESMKRLIQKLEEANRKRQQELEYYLKSLHSEARSANEFEFTVCVINYSLQVWQALSAHFSRLGLCLEVPDACPGQSDDLMYTWSKAEHYLECEIFGSGAVEFFYRNRKSGGVWGEDTTLENGFSTAILEKAAFFAW